MFETLLRRGLRTSLAYIAAVALVGALLLLLLRVHATGDIVWLAFLLPVLAGGAVGGSGPAVVAAALGVFAIDYYFLAPSPAFTPLSDAHQVIAFLAFTAASALAARIAHVSYYASLQQERAEAASAQVVTAA